MKPDEIDKILSETLEDRRLTRTEKRALGQVFEDIDLEQDGRAFWRHRAFAIARNEIRHPDAKEVLDWLEAVIKVLQPRTDEPRDSDVSVYFSPGDACLNAISRLLHDARKSVDICVFTITDDRLARAIIAAHERGVKVRIITDNDKSNDLGSDARRLAKAGISVRTDRSEHHMHHKYAVFDQAAMLTGSYNWTRSAAMNNRENLMVSRDPRLVRKFTQDFEELWYEFRPRD